MGDFDKCSSTTCKLSHKCSRFLERDINEFQWVTNYYKENEECKHFRKII